MLGQQNELFIPSPLHILCFKAFIQAAEGESIERSYQYNAP